MGFFNKSELEKKYTVVDKVIGSGNFAKVKVCKLKSDESKKYALKIIDKAKVEDYADIENEIEIMELIDHEHIIKLIEIFDQKKVMNLVMELVNGGELFDAIVEAGNFSEKDAAKTTQLLCAALDYLHTPTGKRGIIVHRDLKPENILLSNKDDVTSIKIADFGLAKIIKNASMMKTACGTPGYVAPEVLENKGYEGGTPDIWSTGVILYILLCGFPPFFEEELPQLFSKILKGSYDYPSPWWDTIEAGEAGPRNLVNRMLTVDPKKRITAKEVASHPWISAISGDSSAAEAKSAFSIKEFAKYNRARKFKKATQAITAINAIKLKMPAAAPSAPAATPG